MCEHLITAGTSSKAPEYYVMAAAIVTLYGRPFSDNKRIGKIDHKIVPEEFKSLHSTLIELRNKAFAHTDVSRHLLGHGKMTEVRFVFDGRSAGNFSSGPIFEPVSLPHIKTLAERLAQHVKQTHDNFLNRVLSVMVPKFTLADVGKEFELNVEDETSPMVMPSNDPIARTYPMVQ